MKRKHSPVLYTILIVAFLVQAVIQRVYLYNAWVKNYATKSPMGAAGGLSPDQYLFALAGFRELVAGILWVRADDFFDQGNYDAILPIIRLVTTLDPHEIDVYATGMWHIGYNFTDEDQRSDRRYIPSALALGREGAMENPNTYEMFFEVGWMWFNKIDDDYPEAVKWFERAQRRPDMLPARKDLLPIALLRAGHPKQALNDYFNLFSDAKAAFKKSGSYGNAQIMDTLENNVDTTLVRMVQRGLIAEEHGQSLKGYDTYPPFDVGFSVKATIVKPRVIRFEGTWNVLPVGTRITVVLKDANYPHGVPAGMVWNYSHNVRLDPPKNLTFMQDQLFIRNRRFNHLVDMSKDPTMYPFVAKKYLIEFYYNPRSAPPHIQDRFGYYGEGMTDKHFISMSARPGEKVIYTNFTATRNQILRRGQWEDKVPVFETPNFKESRNTFDMDQTILKIPSLRSSAGK